MGDAKLRFDKTKTKFEKYVRGTMHAHWCQAHAYMHGTGARIRTHTQSADAEACRLSGQIGDHDACLLDLRALDTAGLISLEKLNKVKMSLAKLSAIPHKNSSFSATTALQVDSKVHRPHDKLITKMSAYIENMVVKVGKESKEKKATCDQIYSVIEREVGLRNRVINATAVLKRDQHIYDRAQIEQTD